MENSLYDSINEAVETIRATGYDKTPDTALIYGSGLTAVAKCMSVDHEISYEQISGFARSTLDFHNGRLLFGRISGVEVVAMDGRLHCYEGFSQAQVTFPVRVMRMLGADKLLLTNIAGGLNPEYRAGDVIQIVDHINLMGDNPLIGQNDERLGVRFPDMSEPYSRRLISLAEKHSLSTGSQLPRGVYLGLTGPSLETRAEYRMLRILGADLVGMSSVPEVIVAVHGGMEVMGLSVVSDECFPDCLSPVEIDKLLKIAEVGAERIGEILSGVVGDRSYRNVH